jgi:hypothetical protein
MLVAGHKALSYDERVYYVTERDDAASVHSKSTYVWRHSNDHIEYTMMLHVLHEGIVLACCIVAMTCCAECTSERKAATAAAACSLLHLTLHYLLAAAASCCCC